MRLITARGAATGSGGGEGGKWGIGMRLAQIEDGVVVNVIEVDPENRPEWAADWPEAGDAGPGWLWDSEGFTPPPEPDPAVMLAARRATASLSKREFLHACVALDIMSPEDALAAARGDIPTTFAGVVSQMSASEQFAAALDWAAATQIDRLNPLIVAVAAAAGIPDTTVDAVFGIASTEAPS